MNIKDLPQGSYKVVNPTPAKSGLINVKDLPQNSYKVINSGSVEQSKPYRFDQPEDHQSIASLQEAQRQAEEESRKASSFSGMLKNFGIGLVDTVASSEVGLGNSIQRIFGNPQDTYTNIGGQDYETQNRLLKQIKENQAKGKDSSRLEKQYNRNARDIEQSNALAQRETALPSTGQVVGQIGGTALDLLTAGSYGKAAEGAKSFELTSKAKPNLVEGVQKLAQEPSGLFTKKGATAVAKGAGIGYGYDVTQGLQGQRGEDRTNGRAFIPGAGTVVGGLIPVATEGFQSIKNSYNKVSKDVDTLAGTITQGKTGDIANAKKALSNIDISGVKTYQDLGTRLDEKISNLSTKLDDVLSTRSDVRKLDDLAIQTRVGEQTVKHNYVEDALTQLRDFYDKTNDFSNASRIEQLIQKGKNQGLTIKELNDLAREHGNKLNAFNLNGELASGVTKQAVENTRSGLKGTARRLFGDKVYQAVDEQLSSLIKTRSLIKDVEEQVNKLRQKVNPRGKAERFGRLLAQVLDKLTFGGTSGFLRSYLVPSGGGLKTMNALDLEAQLQKNLRQIQRLTEGDLTEVQLIREMEKILNKPPAPIAGYLPALGQTSSGPAILMPGKTTLTDEAMGLKEVAKLKKSRIVRPTGSSQSQAVTQIFPMSPKEVKNTRNKLLNFKKE